MGTLTATTRSCVHPWNGSFPRI